MVAVYDVCFLRVILLHATADRSCPDRYTAMSPPGVISEGSSADAVVVLQHYGAMAAFAGEMGGSMQDTVAVGLYSSL